MTQHTHETWLLSVGEKPDMDRNPPILNHNSRGRSTSSCNCGRKQAPREDPFDIQTANYDFYQVRIHTNPCSEDHCWAALHVLGRYHLCSSDRSDLIPFIELSYAFTAVMSLHCTSWRSAVSQTITVIFLNAVCPQRTIADTLSHWCKNPVAPLLSLGTSSLTWPTLT